MVLAPGDAEGDPGNRHRGADQWLLVVSGSGRALVNGKQQRLSAAYRRDGNPLPRGRK
jgi:hypothetical protein